MWQFYDMIAKGDGVDGVKGVNGINVKIRFRFCSKMQLVLFFRFDVFLQPRTLS